MSPQRRLFSLFLALSLGCSIGWFLYYVVIARTPTGAGRGGDIGLAIAVAFLFINRDYGGALYESLKKDGALLERVRQRKLGLPATPAATTIQDVAQKIAAAENDISILARCVSIEAEGHRTENIYFALATIFCTLLASFGDALAEVLIALR